MVKRGKTKLLGIVFYHKDGSQSFIKNRRPETTMKSEIQLLETQHNMENKSKFADGLLIFLIYSLLIAAIFLLLCAIVLIISIIITL